MNQQSHLRPVSAAGRAAPARRRGRMVAGLAAAAAALALSPSAVADPIAAAAALPAASYGATTLHPLLPDLTALRASHLSIARSGGQRRLRFESDLANIGNGPLELVTNRARPCPRGERHASQVIYRDVDGNDHFKRSVDTESRRRSAGCFVYHVQHNHWHFDAAARYRLYKPGRAGYITQARKVSFCLRDSERVPPRFGAFHQRAYYGDCSLGTPEGIGVGWADVYQWFLSGQSLRLPPRVRSGVYCVSIRVDPKRLLYESDEDDNVAFKAFRIRGATGIEPYRNRVCKRPAP